MVPPINDIQDGGTKSGGLSSASIDSLKLQLTKSDYEKIDTNNSGSASSAELMFASETDDFKGTAKGEAMQALAKSITDGEKVTIDFANHPTALEKSIPSWHGRQFATQQLTDSEFKSLDKNEDNLLSIDELKDKEKIDKLNPMSRHAAGILRDELDAQLNDPLILFTGAVKNWHNDAAKEEAPVAPLEAVVPGLKMDVEHNLTSVYQTDAHGRPTKIERGHYLYDLAYDEKGRVSEIKESSWGKPQDTTTISYDCQNMTRTISQTDAKGNSLGTTISYLDKDGKVQKVESIDRDGGVTTSEMDEEGRVVKQSESYEGSVKDSTVVYSGNGVRDVTTIAYDDMGHVVSEGHNHRDGARSSGSIKYFRPDGSVHRELSNSFGPNSHTRVADYSTTGKLNYELKVSFADGKNPNEVRETDAAGNTTILEGRWENGNLVGVTKTNPDGTKQSAERNSLKTSAEKNLFAKSYRTLMYQRHARYIPTTQVDGRPPGDVIVFKGDEPA